MKIKIFFYIFCFLITYFKVKNQNKLLEVYKNLRCLVCQGQSIADSNSDFAATIKLVVQDQFKKEKQKMKFINF